MTTLLGLPMPQPGETITEGLVVRWIKNVGDVVAEKEPVVELETAKAVYEYESPIAGKLTKIVTPAGVEQRVGQPLALLECDDAAAKKYLRLGIGLPTDAAGNVIAGGPAQIGAMAGAGGEYVGAVAASAPAAAPAKGGGGLQLPPFIRTLAKEHGLSDAELAAIPPTGVGGRLSKDDVLKFLATRKGGAGAGPTAGAPVQAIAGGTRAKPLPAPLSGSPRREPDALRRRIAENMVLAKSTIPHAGSAVRVDMTDLMTWREQHKVAFEQQHGVKLRLAPMFLLAVREALKQFPAANNFYFIDADGKHWVETHSFMNLGVAVGTKRGLMVPVIKQAQDKDFVDLARASHDLMERAAVGKITPDELTGATITVNNPGALGSIRGNQILAYPQAMIIGFHAVIETACRLDGQWIPRQIMELDTSFDHRMIDGVEAVGVLNACKAVLEAPARYFAV